VIVIVIVVVIIVMIIVIRDVLGIECEENVIVWEC
jgi:hypothetical protein